MGDKARIMRWNEATAVEALAGLMRRALAQTDNVMIVEFRSDAGVVIPEHSHPNQQVGYVVSGMLELTLNGKSHRLNPGDSYAIPGDAPHSAVFVQESIIIDCFSPPREDYQTD
jgi:quercetin dioxygenase-like cupin family protein